MKSTVYVLLLVVAMTTPAVAAELWITPAVDPAAATVGDWAVTSSSETHFTFAIPGDFRRFVGAKVVVIGEVNKDSAYDLSISISQPTLPFDDFAASIPGTPVTFRRDQLMEVDISEILRSTRLYAGMDSVSLVFSTKFAQILGLRFQYENGDLVDLKHEVDAETESRLSGDSGLAEAIKTGDASVREDLANEAATRATADSVLAERIEAEASARLDADRGEETRRKEADNGLTTAINKERTARENGDTSIQSALDAETAARTATDTSLQTQVNDEKVERQSKDFSLQTDLGELQSQIHDSCASCARKTFYLTQDPHTGDTIGTACGIDAGYHVADAQELAGIINMEYADVEGAAPPRTAFRFEDGWYFSFMMTDYEVGNCHDFTSSSGAGHVMRIFLNLDYESGRTQWQWPYTVGVEQQDCAEPARVWCVSD